MRVCANCPVQAECLAIWEELKDAAYDLQECPYKSAYQNAIESLISPKLEDVQIQHVISDILSLLPL